MTLPQAIPVAALVLVCPVVGQNKFAAAVSEEITLRPQSAAQDIYKLAHQSVFGPGHIISSQESARGYLEEEMASLGRTMPREKITEELGGGMVRVNLRPYRDSGGSTERLLDAMMDTAKDAAGPERAGAMAERIETARAALLAQGKKELADELGKLADELGKKGYPALHHSEAYRNAYLPAYRVVESKAFASQ